MAGVAVAIFFFSFVVGFATVKVEAPTAKGVAGANVTSAKTVKVTTEETEPTTRIETEDSAKKATEEYSDLVVDISVAKAEARGQSNRTAIEEATTKTKVETESLKSKKSTVEQTTAAKAAEIEVTKAEVDETEVETATETEPAKEEETKAEEPTTQVSTKKGSGSVQISDDEYYYICCLLYGEAGAEPYDGQILVAQCFYNAMEECGCDAYTTAKKYGYTGSTKKGTNESCKKAVAAVFYDGYRYTNEPVLFFYSPRYMKNHWSSWHESQTFVCEVGGHRFFKRNGV